MPQTPPPGFQIDPALSQQMGVPIAVNPSTGKRLRLTGGQQKGQMGDAAQRGKLAMGMGGMVDGNERMMAAERDVNPLQRDWGAALIDKIPWMDDVAKMVGGQDYQDYSQAAKQFESEILPIKAGAAQTPSEAKRQVRAALPELGDSPQSLASKAKARKMMLNGAARSMGNPLPYPDVPTFGVNSNKLGSPASAPAANTPKTSRLVIDINGRPIK